MTAVLPDVDALQQLDWTREAPCTLESCRFGRPAATHRTWLDAPCTSSSELACRGCAEMLTGALTIFALIICSHCGANRICVLGDWLHLEPLR